MLKGNVNVAQNDYFLFYQRHIDPAVYTPIAIQQLRILESRSREQHQADIPTESSAIKLSRSCFLTDMPSHLRRSSSPA
jgi:hypothetical protein